MKTLTQVPTNNILLATPIAPTLPIPNKAKLPRFDLNDPNLSITDVYAPNFFNGQLIVDLRNETGQWPVFTVTACNIEPVYNPETDEEGEETEFKAVLSFAETAVRLVLNTTRSREMARIVGSKYFRDFHKAGRLELSVPGGLDRKGRGEIVLQPAPAEKPNGRKAALPDDYTPQQANDDLFAS